MAVFDNVDLTSDNKQVEALTTLLKSIVIAYGTENKLRIPRSALAKAMAEDSTLWRFDTGFSNEVILELETEDSRVAALAETLKSQGTVHTPETVRKAVKKAWGIDL